MSRRKQSDFDPAHAAAHGYTKVDWDAVDSPELTAEELAHPMTFAQAHPDLAATIKRRGRPPVESPKSAVTLRLAPATIERFKAAGPDWRAKMARALDKAKV